MSAAASVEEAGQAAPLLALAAEWPGADGIGELPGAGPVVPVGEPAAGLSLLTRLPPELLAEYATASQRPPGPELAAAQQPGPQLCAIPPGTARTVLPAPSLPGPSLPAAQPPAAPARTQPSTRGRGAQPSTREPQAQSSAREPQAQPSTRGPQAQPPAREPQATQQHPPRADRRRLCGEAGQGFGFGGAADTLTPGPVLATLADRAWATGLAALSEDELVGVLRAGRRLSSWAAALELAAAADLMRRREEYGDATGDLEPGAHASDEVAAALTVTMRSAGRLLDLSMSLRRLPGTAGALRAGDIDLARAAVMASEISCLSDEHAAAVERRVLPSAPRQTTGLLRAALRRAVIAVDPAAASSRKQRAEQDARVERWDEPAGTAALAGRDLPPAAVLAADQNLTALAEQLRTAGAPGTLDNLRARAYLWLLSGEPLSVLLAQAAAEQTPASSAATAWPLPAQETSPARETSPATETSPAIQTGAGWRSGDPGCRARPGFRGSVNLTMPLATWLGGSEMPGHVAGYGPVDAADSRTLAAAVATHLGNRWCITMTDEHGRPVAHGCARTGAGPGNATWTITITPLEGSTCTHSRQAGAYRPPPSLRHVVEIRNRTCTYPGCRRAAQACDQDHTQPYDKGGRTCECNLSPLCRRHHRAKQTHGWHLEQPQPGVMVWILPSGRAYTTRPTIYPNE